MNNTINLSALREEGFKKLIDRISGDDAYIIDGEDIKLSGKYYEKQMRLALRNYGIINPESIDEYIGRGGYSALEKAIFELSSEIGRASCRERV